VVATSSFPAFPSAQNEGENRKLKGPWKIEKRREKKPNVNLIFSHVNHTFFILDHWIGPKPFRHSLYLRKIGFFNLKKGPIQGSICFKLIPGLLVPVPLSKVILRPTRNTSLQKLFNIE
jgi:hypothetical protein